MGHTVIVKGGRKCNCGRNGCWEKYASSRALTEDTKAAMQEHTDSLMWKMDAGHRPRQPPSSRLTRMAKGDAVAKQVVENWMDYVACGLANVVNTFEPEVICVGGGVIQPGRDAAGPGACGRAKRDAEHHDRSLPRDLRLASCATMRA